MMRGLHHALDGTQIQADAFYAPDHDLLVLAPERLDSVGQTFLQQTDHVFAKGLNRGQLLDGLMPKLDSKGEKGAKPNDVARATTLALVEKLATDEAEIAAVSREGTRQLMFASYQLPKHVTLPNWLTNGSVNAMSRPRGPAYVTIGDEDKPFMHVAMTTGYGVPNYVLQRYFRDLEEHKELPADRAVLLEHVLTDAYFHGIKNADDPDPAPPKKKTGREPAPPPKSGPGLGGPPIGQPGSSKGPDGMMGPPGGKRPGRGEFGPGAAGTTPAEEDPTVTQRKKRDRLIIKAHSTSWALYYYLVREKPELLRSFVAELDKFPRDLPIDGRTSYLLFVQVFGLTDADGQTDPEKFRRFAKEWVEYTTAIPLVGFDVAITMPEPPKDTTPGKGPQQPKGSPAPGPGRGRP
jgi:hypothetical protein